MVGGMSAFFIALSCLNEEEFAASASAWGMTPEDRDGLQCLFDLLGGPQEMAATLGSGDESGFKALFGAAMECGLNFGGAGPGLGG